MKSNFFMSFLRLVARCTAIPPQRIQGEYFDEGYNPVMGVLCGNLLGVQMFIIAKEAWYSKFLSYFKIGFNRGLTSSVPPSYHTVSAQTGSRSNTSGGSLFCTSHHMDVVKAATLRNEKHTKTLWKIASTLT